MVKSRRININSVLETLSDLAEVEGDEKLELILPKQKKRRGRKPKKAKVSLTLSQVSEMFSMILEHLESEVMYQENAFEKMKMIMLVVGEAARSLDKVSNSFRKKKVTTLPEYRRLQLFYRENLDRRIDENVLGKWMLGLMQSSGDLSGRIDADHLLVDLDTVRKDTEYELMLIRREDGTRFYNPGLIRNLKLVCDFGGHIGSRKEKDVFEEILDWKEGVCYSAAVSLLSVLQLSIRHFYDEAYRHRHKDLAAAYHKSLMALCLAANPKNLPENQPVKTCAAYFADFMKYMRIGLGSRFYQKLIAYPPKKTASLSCCLRDVVQSTCRAMHLHLNIVPVLRERVEHVLQEVHLRQSRSIQDVELGSRLWSQLAYEYAEVARGWRLHSTGPLKRLVEMLESGENTAFDPYLQSNLPHQWFDIHWDKRLVSHVRMPTPTRQTTVNKSIINDEFKGFLLGHGHKGREAAHLIVNLQDRNDWRSASRCKAIEQLATAQDFCDHLDVITLATDTSFYNQTGSYKDQNSTEHFIKSFKEQLIDPSAGCFFPTKIRDVLIPLWTDHMMDLVHRECFDEQKTLSQEERCAFISICYLLITLKVIEVLNVESFSFTCKDAIDTGSAYSALLFVFMTLIKEKSFSDELMEHVHLMLYGPALLIRERAIHEDVFKRIVGSVHVIEDAANKITFKGLFEGDILRSDVTLPLAYLKTNLSAAA